MDVWYFTGRAGFRAVTLDESGSNLPKDHGPWKLLRNALLPDGEGSGPVHDALRAGGYYLYAGDPESSA